MRIRPLHFLALLCIPLFSGQGFTSMQAGIYAPDTASTHFLAVRRTLETFGIPYTVSTRMAALKKCPAVIAAGPLREKSLVSAEVQEMYRYAEEGGALLLAGEIGKSLFPLAGITKAVASQKRFFIRVREPATDSILRYVTHRNEKTWRLGNPKLFKKTVWTFGAGLKDAAPLARFDDSTVALCRREVGPGKVYYLAVGWDAAILTPQIGMDREAQENWVNFFEPTTDMFMLLMKALYQASAFPYFYASLHPGFFRTSLILTHDVDARESFRNAVVFAKMEKRYGFKSTFFITTKNFTDSTDTAYFTPAAAGYVRELDSMGFSVGSHTVSHLKAMDRFPLGQRLAARSEYRPLVKKTLYGELQVSRWLLQDCGVRPLSFRTGHLSYPPQLAGALEECGYRINSTFSAGDVMCNFPFYALASRNLGAAETRVLEIPVTLDESMGFLTKGNADKVVGHWASVIRENMDNEAVTTLLIHPNILGYKYRAEQALLEKVQSKKVWIGDLESYWRFHREREKVRVERAEYRNHTLVLTLNTPYEDIPADFSLVAGPWPAIKKIRVHDNRNKVLSFSMERESGRVRLWSIGLDQRFYEFQRKMVVSIAILFLAVILLLCAFLCFQRMAAKVRAKVEKPAEYEEKALAVLFSEQEPGEKVAGLRKLGRPDHARRILLEQTGYLKGKEKETLAGIYRVMGFFRRDIAELKKRGWWKRAAAAGRLGQLGDSDAEADLLPLLSDKQVEVRIAAAVALGQTRSIGAIPDIIKAVETSDPFTAGMMVQALVPVKAEARRYLIKMVEEEPSNPGLQAQAVAVLGELRDIEAVPALVPLLDSPDLDLKLAILTALGKISDEGVLPAVYPLLVSENEALRTAALRTVARIGSAAAVPELMKFAEAADARFARDAINALVSLGDAGKGELIRLILHGADRAPDALQALQECGYFDEQVMAYTSGNIDRQFEHAEVFLTLLIRRGFVKRIGDLSTREGYERLAELLEQEKGKGS